MDITLPRIMNSLQLQVGEKYLFYYGGTWDVKELEEGEYFYLSNTLQVWSGDCDVIYQLPLSPA